MPWPYAAKAPYHDAYEHGTGGIGKIFEAEGKNAGEAQKAAYPAGYEDGELRNPEMDDCIKDAGVLPHEQQKEGS